MWPIAVHFFGILQQIPSTRRLLKLEGGAMALAASADWPYSCSPNTQLSYMEITFYLICLICTYNIFTAFLERKRPVAIVFSIMETNLPNHSYSLAHQSDTQSMSTA